MSIYSYEELIEVEHNASDARCTVRTEPALYVT